MTIGVYDAVVMALGYGYDRLYFCFKGMSNYIFTSPSLRRIDLCRPSLSFASVSERNNLIAPFTVELCPFTEINIGRIPALRRNIPTIVKRSTL
jgi:hypothetical protein